MKIKDVKARIMKPLDFVQVGRPGFPPSELVPILITVDTDDGISGHFLTIFCAESYTAQIPLMRQFLVGHDPYDVGAISGQLRAVQGMAFMHTPNLISSAIDICLWDILAKKAGVPLYKYLGACRDRMRAYASVVKHERRGKAFFNSDQVYIDEALRCRKEGFTAFKVHGYDVPDMDMRVCRAVREAVGEDMDLMLDPVCAYDRRDAFRVGRVLEELKFYWYEDPIPGTDIEGLADLSRTFEIPIAVGETMYLGLEYYPQYLIRHAGDIIRIIGETAGGITAMMKLAHMCEGFNVNCEPHSYGSVLSQAACLHVMLATRNCDFFEMPVPVGIFDFGMKDVIRISEDGYVDAPTKPGLGYDIDWDVVEKSTVKSV